MKYPISFSRKKRLHQRLVQDEDETMKIGDPETEEFDSEAPPVVNGGANGKTPPAAPASNGHAVSAQVHFVRPTKRGAGNKKEKDKSRTSYHLTVAEDEASMINSDTCSELDNT